VFNVNALLQQTIQQYVDTGLIRECKPVVSCTAPACIAANVTITSSVSIPVTDMLDANNQMLTNAPALDAITANLSSYARGVSSRVSNALFVTVIVIMVGANLCDKRSVALMNSFNRNGMLTSEYVQHYASRPHLHTTRTTLSFVAFA
jgi:hypothetical protein